MGRTETLRRQPTAFSHEALLYRGDADRVEQLAAFIRDGINVGETPCIVVDGSTIEAVTRAIGTDAERLRSADMRVVGRNPGRLISVWTDLLHEVTAAGGRIRGVGEPVWATRTAEELLECSRHEALLNLAFANGPAWRLACPYDVSALPPGLVEEARRNHPALVVDGRPDPSAGFQHPVETPAQLTDPLTPAPATAWSSDVSLRTLAEVRRAVDSVGTEIRLDPPRVRDLALALDEVASNSIRYGGDGIARVWATDEALFAEVEDHGRIDDPLAGRRRPVAGATSGFGLWLAHQLCDLVQIRSTPTGTLVRLRVARYLARRFRDPADG